MRLFTKKIPIRSTLLTAMIVGVSLSIVAMYHSESGIPLTVSVASDEQLPASSSTKADKVTIPQGKSLFDINGDGILDFLDFGNYSSYIYISDGNGYIMQKTDIKYSYYYYLCCVYQLNDDVMVGLSNASNKRRDLITFSKADYKTIDQIEAKITPADVDNDGQMEYLAYVQNNNENRVIYYKIEPDGKITSYPLQIYTPETETEESEEETGRSFVAWDYSMLGASMAQMFGRDGSGGSMLSDENIFQVTDLNGDGLPDIINSNEAKIYINIGNGTYYEQSFSGSTFFADFNGDGICDYVVVDDTNIVCCITNPEGGAPSEKTILSGFKLGNIWCRDVDKDGDSDLILIVTGSSQCFGVIMENKGNGTFKRHEYSLPHIIDSAGNNCSLYDWDNDGYYEILSISDNTTYNAYSTKITGTTIVTTPTTFDLGNESTEFYPEPSCGKIKSYQRNKAIQILSNNFNNRPAPPAEAPAVVYESKTGLVKISWPTGNDVETPVADLTYSVKVGTSPGADDVVRPQADTDGMRLWPEEGNAGRMRYRIYDTSSWPHGKLYISVQTVDGNMQGSRFSAETVFEKSVPACEFQMDYCDYFAVNDTLTLTVNRMDGTPQWNVDDGRIVGSDDNAFKVVFAKSGEKNISLTMAHESGEISAPRSKKLNVLEAPVHEGSIIGEREGKGIVNVNAWTSFDMDEDGIDEIYHSEFYYNEGGFLKGDSNGVYRKINKMFNSHQYAGKFYGEDGVGTFDINRDGLCDIAYREYLGYNLGDLDMEFENTGGGLVKWLDLDNDGLYDAVGKGGAYRNDGDYKSFKSNYVYFGDATLFGDFNHDGLIDIADAQNRGHQINILYNNGDFTFTEDEPIVLPDDIDFGGLHAVEDIDSDGKLDVLFQNIYHYNGSDFWTLLLGNGQVIKRPGSISGYYDFNNDGIKEIVSGSDVYYLSNGSLKKEKFNPSISSVYGDDAFVLSDGTRHVTQWSGYTGGKRRALSIRLSATNERPLPPTNLRHTQNDKAVIISWDHSADKETPAAQMRYNISVKHKGATGDGAYLLSPANSGKNGVRVPLHKPLIHANRITIPVANIPAGNYEVKVQGVDMMHDQSDFSETYEMHVAESSSVDAPTSGEVNVPVRIKVLSNTDVDMDWDGGELSSASSGIYDVVWTTAGIKTITIDGQQSKIKIDAAPDPAFTFPDGIRYRDVVTVKGSLVNQGSWYAVESKYSGVYDPNEGWVYKDEETNLLTPNEFADFEIIDSETANITIKKYNKVLIRHKVSSSFSTQTCDRSVNVPYDNNISGVSQKEETASNPSIDYVTADDKTGKYKIQWTNPEKVRPEAIGIQLYRETAVAGKYLLLAELPLDATEYTDNASNPDIVASRYVLAYKLSFGRSCYSRAHQPVHVMINRGAGLSWNLIWGRYEGRTIPKYRILRGESPESLHVIAEVSGNMTSYTDFTAPSSGSLYYAVESVLEPQTAVYTQKTRKATASDITVSNIVAAAGSNINMATSIKVLSIDGNTVIDGSDTSSSQSVQLIALIDPSTVTFRRPSWIVIDGEDLVNVDNLGNVTATGNGSGSATVRAMTIDGSGLYADINITVKGFSGVGNIISDKLSAEKLVLYPVPADNEVNIVTYGENIDIYIFSLGGRIAAQLNSEEAVTTVDCSNWAAGVYIVKAINKNNGITRYARFIKR